MSVVPSDPPSSGLVAHATTCVYIIYVRTVRDFAPIPMYRGNETPCAIPTLRVLPHSDNCATCTVYMRLNEEVNPGNQ